MSNNYLNTLNQQDIIPQSIQASQKTTSNLKNTQTQTILEIKKTENLQMVTYSHRETVIFFGEQLNKKRFLFQAQNQNMLACRKQLKKLYD